MSNATDLLDLIATIEDPELRALADWWLYGHLLRDLDLDVVAVGVPTG